MNKEALRKAYFRKRKDLSDAQFNTLEDKVLKQLSEIPEFAEKQVVHTYLPLKDKKEINTWPAIRILWSQGKRVVIPSISSDGKMMNCLELEANHELEALQWGLLEPTVKKQAIVDDIEVIIIPLLCFDTRGHRVGYGKGFYDRFISNLNRNILKIGLSLFDPVSSIDDIDPWDEPLNICVTPEEVYRFEG